VFEARADHGEMARRYGRWRDAVERAKGWNAEVGQ
jgi:glycerol kinase